MKNVEIKTIDQYISLYSGEAQTKLKEIRNFIKELIPEATEAISYKMPTYDLNGKHLIHFAAFSKHIGFYPFPSGIKAFKEEIKNYKTSTGTIQFPLNNPLPFDLIKKIILFRLKEVENK